LFAYNCARKDPQRLFIGIDANRRPLEKLSEKIHRGPSKGGAPNVLFFQAAVEALPSELEGIATEAHVNFPWGSLLRGVAGGDIAVLHNLRRICKTNAFLKIVIGLDLERDSSEIVRLRLSELDASYINSELVKVYQNAGFDLVRTENIAAWDQPEFQTSWARRLRTSRNRSYIHIVARAV
jgi:16S rRNA (adenine(1408)-N(1))-methyltransferase